MTIRDLTIPPLLVSMIADGQLHRAIGSWHLSTDRDYYGNFWESELGQVYQSDGEIEQATAQLHLGFPPEAGNETDDFSSQPGFIPYINDFTGILEFAISSDGSPFCLDFRESIDEPAVIWWDDSYWRRVAPSFPDFISLFDLASP